MSAPVERIVATPGAREAIAEVTADGGPIMFFQSGGCCDGSLPICFRDGEFTIGNHDVRLGTVGGSAFYMDHRQFEAWKHTQLILDVVPGRGGMFSLDNGEGVRFLIRSRIFDGEEIRDLRAAGRI